MSGLAHRKKQRLVVLTTAVIALVGAASLFFFAMSGDSFSLFRQPADLVANPPAEGQRVRLGGLVEDGSLIRLADGVTHQFAVTDCVATVAVTYRGILPDLFREGQGVVTEGLMSSPTSLTADTVLAKHDENYVPKGSMPKNMEACTHPEQVAAYQREQSAP